MRNFSIVITAIFTLFCSQIEAQTKLSAVSAKEQNMNRETIYQFKVTDIFGKTLDMSTLKGKKVMIVNTASKCGLTPQYKDLENLYQQYKDKGFVIVGFPANNFGEQEPGSNKEIAQFCELNYGVTFPMMEKISVKGDEMHELYKFLTIEKRNGLQDSKVEWNFQKYLIDEQGYLVRVVDSKTLPTDKSIIRWIQS